MYEPVIVVGTPRSRTSLVMQMLEICGLYLGNVIQKTTANPQGQKENHEIISKIVKPELKVHGFDPKCQKPLPPPEWYVIDKSRRTKVLEIIEKQGLKDRQKWGFKATKAVFNWQGWADAFPNAIWIIVRRNDADIVASCMSPKATFMDRRKTTEEWGEWVDAHKIKFEEMKEHLNYVYELDTDRIVDGDLSQLKSIISIIGLEWKPKRLHNQICP